MMCSSDMPDSRKCILSRERICQPPPTPWNYLCGMDPCRGQEVTFTYFEIIVKRVFWALQSCHSPCINCGVWPGANVLRVAHVHCPQRISAVYRWTHAVEGRGFPGEGRRISKERAFHFNYSKYRQESSRGKRNEGLPRFVCMCAKARVWASDL